MSAAGEDHTELMLAAIERDGAAQQALFERDLVAARRDFTQAAQLYRRSWEVAPPASYGRLVGMLKAAVLGGGGAEESRFARQELPDDADSPPAAYAHALAALIDGDDDGARRWSERMRAGPEAFARTAEAIKALAERDRERYANALRAIVTDFEARTEHLTGVPIADTALMLEQLASRRGITIRLQSPLLPAA